MCIPKAEWSQFNHSVEDGLKHSIKLFSDSQADRPELTEVWERIDTDLKRLDCVRKNEIQAFEKEEKRWKYLQYSGDIVTAVILTVDLIGEFGQGFTSTNDSNTTLVYLANGLKVIGAAAALVAFGVARFFQWKRTKTLEELAERKKLSDKDILDLQKLITIIKSFAEIKESQENADIDVDKVFELACQALQTLPDKIDNQPIPCREAFLTPLLNCLPPTHELNRTIDEALTTLSSSSDEDEFTPAGHTSHSSHFVPSTPREKKDQQEEVWNKIERIVGFKLGTFRVTRGDAIITLHSPHEVVIGIDSDIADLEG